MKFPYYGWKLRGKDDRFLVTKTFLNKVPLVKNLFFEMMMHHDFIGGGRGEEDWGWGDGKRIRSKRHHLGILRLNTAVEFKFEKKLTRCLSWYYSWAYFRIDPVISLFLSVLSMLNIDRERANMKATSVSDMKSMKSTSDFLNERRLLNASRYET